MWARILFLEEVCAFFTRATENLHYRIKCSAFLRSWISSVPKIIQKIISFDGNLTAIDTHATFVLENTPWLDISCPQLFIRQNGHGSLKLPVKGKKDRSIFQRDIKCQH